MNQDDLKKRTKKFALRIIKLVNNLPKNNTGKVISGQLLRSGTSVAANYRAVCRARSKAEFISKMGIVIEEADESVFWLELIIESNLLKEELVKQLLQEANEIVAIMVSSKKTASENKIVNRQSSIVNQKGYITLISVITIGAIGLSIVLFLLLAGANSAKSVILLERSVRARALVNACGEEALWQIRNSTSFEGSGTLSIESYICDYNVVKLTGQNRIIYASSTVQGVVRKVQIDIDKINPSINIIGWQEAGDF